MNRLARTQRDIIRSDIETADETIPKSTIASDIVNGEPERSPGYPFDVDDRKNDDNEDHNTVPCCCRGLLFGLGLLSLLAGGIVLIVLFKEPTPDASRGVITDNEVKGQCNSLVSFSSVRLDCVLKNRPYFLNNGTVEAAYRNGSMLPADAVNCMNGTNSSSVVCNITYAVKCSSRESLFVKFLDSNKDVVFKHTINAAAPVGEMYTHITQTFTNNVTTSEFDLECWYNDTCYSYYIGFYNEIGTEIKDGKECTSSYSDDDGYTTKCRSVVSGDVMLEYTNGSRLYCEARFGSMNITRKEFEFPNCATLNSTNTACNNPDIGPFNCSSMDRDKNCSQECTVAEECLPSRFKKVENITCPCVLKWCRQDDDFICS
ncbi:uncharacterized protein LOC123553983 [Mercenaria mercenaria]|uniref:uncharacterized protein LOC123553983 n=1 Tax=Mercenaria mercenaria TaxID=6596 RepID=UPI00234F6FAC|nr:uncharacterized protein LOC123553983 [Mercenaria mercenaria]